MEKKSSFHHSVTELGNIQVRLVTEYLKDGEIIDKKYSDPYAPLNVKYMTGFDDRSKEIVVAITTPKVKAEFKAEMQTITGTGIEEEVRYDRIIEPDGKIAVRRITRIYDDGVEVSKKYHRTWIMPGDDPTNADIMSKALAKKLHTVKVIAAYKGEMAKSIE